MLRERAIRGSIWNGVQHVGRQAIKFIISILLARLLLPSDYGVIGMIMVFIAISQTFVDSGFSQALIQRKETTHVDECSVFYLNIALSIVLYAILCLGAPYIADFYGMPELALLTWVLSLRLVVSSFGLVQSTLLSKKIDFISQAKVTLVSVSVSGIIGIAMAYCGFGVWSLVAQSLLSSSIFAIGMWIVSEWRPSLSFSFASVQSLFGFGSKILCSQLIDTFFRNIYTLVIGKLYSPADLGNYARGASLVQLPVDTIAIVIRRVTFPVFSSINDDKIRLKKGIKKTLVVMFFITCPIVFGIALVADTLVYVLLTEKWAACIPYIQLLCISGALYPLHVINVNALLAIGRSDLNLRLELIKKSLTIVILFITYRWGIEAMIIGQIFQSFLAYIINGYYTGQLLSYSYLEQLRDIFPYILTTIAMAIGVNLVKMLVPENLVFSLIIQVGTGAFIYLVLSYIFKLSAFMELYGIVNKASSKN